MNLNAAFYDDIQNTAVPFYKAMMAVPQQREQPGGLTRAEGGTNPPHPGVGAARIGGIMLSGIIRLGCKAAIKISERI